MPKTSLSAISIAVVFLSPLAFAPAFAESSAVVHDAGFVEDTGAANRIVAGDMLRSLSQEIPAAVCHLHNGVDTEDASELLIHSVELFDKALNGLQHGDEDLGIIGAEERRKTIVEIEALRSDWEPIRASSLAVLDNPADAIAAHAVYDTADMMLEKTYHLLSGLEGEYANPAEILQSDIMLLEISGRLAAMNQRLAFEACRVWSGDNSEEAVTALRESMSIYENSLSALSNGLPAMGILPPPTAEIADKLREINGHWGETHDNLVSVADGEEITETTRYDIYHGLAVKLHAIEQLEHLYEDYSKRVY